MHSTRVALARWTSGHSEIEMQVEKALRPSSQARWHDAAHAHFMAWLAAGGFGADGMDEADPADQLPRHESMLAREHARDDAQVRLDPHARLMGASC